jgi:hypothetical protein
MAAPGHQPQLLGEPGQRFGRIALATALVGPLLASEPRIAPQVGRTVGTTWVPARPWVPLWVPNQPDRKALKQCLLLSYRASQSGSGRCREPLKPKVSRPVEVAPVCAGLKCTPLSCGWRPGEVSVFEAVAFAFEGEDLGVVDEAVDHCGRDGVVAEDLSPGGEGLV